MPALDRDRFRSLARLARLELDPREEATLERQLGEILRWVARLDAVVDEDPGAAAEAASPDVGAAAGAAPLDALRADEPRPSLDRDDALANAPAVEAGHYRVPRVLA